MMKKVIIITTLAFMFCGAAVAGVAWLTYPGRYHAIWSESDKHWIYKGVPGSIMNVSYDLRDAKVYRDDERQFSLQYPREWQVQRSADGQSVTFYAQRDTLFWSPERQDTISLTIHQAPTTDCGIIRSTWEQRFAEIERGQTKFYAGLPWIIYDLPIEHREHSISPYPRGVLEFADWCLIVHNFRPEIFETFRYDGSQDVLKYELPPKIVPFVQYGSRVDSTDWPSTTFPEFDLAFKHPPEWRNPQFVKSDTPEDIRRKEFYFGKQVGLRYTAAWAEKMIYVFIFTDDYNGWQEEGSIFFFPPVSLDNPAKAFKELGEYFSFFEGSIMESSALGKGKVLRAFEDRGYGERNIAVTYFIPQVNSRWNIYVIADLNDPIDLEAAGKPFLSSRDLFKLLQDKAVREKISLVDEIVRNISVAE